MEPGGPVVVIIILLLTNLAFVVATATSTNFSFPSFSADDGTLLKVDDVQWSSTLHSFELNYRTYATGLLDQECGRLLYKDKVRLFDPHSGATASFNTSFSFAFQQFSDTNSSTCGAGLAFTFVTSGTSITEREYSRRGKGMCAFDNADTSVSNRVVAVKFDSALTNVTGYRDPSDSNIGVVVTDRGNTSEHTYNLCGNGTEFCAFFCGNKGVFSAWIDYDSGNQVLEVRFRAGSLSSGGKPDSALIRVTDLRLNGDVLENEEMYVGFSGSTFWSREVHRIHAWSFNSSAVPTSSDDQSPTMATSIGISCAVVFGAALVGIIIVFYFWHKKKNVSSPQSKLDLSFSNTAPRSFTYKELRKATKNFSASELLSSGSFGDVYRGTLPSRFSGEGALVAVKRIKSSANEEGEESFLAEATSLRQIRHRNLLQLRGWCQENQNLLLVYDYLCNGSLDKWLHHKTNLGRASSPLPWSVRRLILAGVASALAYLHEDWVQCILHRDIKSSNVMLDENFKAHLGDFGLARLVDHAKVEKTTLLAGTLGYMAPEMTYTGRATKETDVYAFGILVLEVVCGRRPLSAVQQEQQQESAVLLDCVWRAYEAGSLLSVADSRLSTVIEQEEEKGSIVRSLELGLLCCHPNPGERPSMRMVNQWFQAAPGFNIDLPALPATRPFSEYSDMILGIRTSSSGEVMSTSTVSSFRQWPSSDTGSF